MPQTVVGETVRHELLHDKMSRVIVGILIAIAVAQLCHELCGRIAQMQRHRLVARVTHELQGSADTHVC